jgi:hypothetical protein
MMRYSYTFLAAFALTALGLALSGCQQAPPPPATTTVIEDVHRGHDDKDDRKMQDRDHPRPDEPTRRDHPDDAPKRP